MFILTLIRLLDLKDKPGADLPLMDVPYQYWDSNANFWLYLTIVASCVFVIMLLITIGLRKRIKGMFDDFIILRGI